MNATVTSATTVREVATAYATSTVTERETLTETKTEVQTPQEFNIYGLRCGEIALIVSSLGLFGLVIHTRAKQPLESSSKPKNTSRKAKKPSTPPTTPPSGPAEEKPELGGLSEFGQLIQERMKQVSADLEKQYGSKPNATP